MYNRFNTIAHTISQWLFTRKRERISRAKIYVVPSNWINVRVKRTWITKRSYPSSGYGLIQSQGRKQSFEHDSRRYIGLRVRVSR